eukprot:10736275-Lingulodinium_polyedra.AAC.1
MARVRARAWPPRQLPQQPRARWRWPERRLATQSACGNAGAWIESPGQNDRTYWSSSPVTATTWKRGRTCL